MERHLRFGRGCPACDGSGVMDVETYSAKELPGAAAGWIAARAEPAIAERSVHDRGERRLDAGSDVRGARAARSAVAAGPRVRGRRARRSRRRPRSQPERPQGEPPRLGARRCPPHGRHGGGPARERAGGTRTSCPTSPATVCSMSCTSVWATTDTRVVAPWRSGHQRARRGRRAHPALSGTGSDDPYRPRGQPVPVGDVPRRG